VVVQLPTDVFPVAYAVTVYPLIADPRDSSGSSHRTVTAALPAVATTFIGAVGAAFTEALVEADEATEEPAALVATTLKVYELPATKLFVTLHVVAGAIAVQVAPDTAFPALS
jgi:hypothetical protein